MFTVDTFNKNGKIYGVLSTIGGHRMLQSIYIISKENGICKIGIAGNPQKRLPELQTGNESILTLAYYSKPVANAQEIETEIHKRHKATHLNFEWYKIDDIEALKAEIDAVVAETGISEDRGREYFLSQESIGRLAAERLTKHVWRVFLFLSAMMDGSNNVTISQKEIAENLDIQCGEVSKSIRKLIDIDVATKTGKQQQYRLNPKIVHSKSVHASNKRYMDSIARYEELKRRQEV